MLIRGRRGESTHLDFPAFTRDMTYDTINRKRVLDGVGLLPGCSRRFIKRLLTNEPGRLKYLEWYLPRLEREKKVYASWYEGEKIYALTKNRVKNMASVLHDQVCGEALIRFRWSSRELRYFSESELRGLNFGAVPEFSMLTPDGTQLCFEYSTENNFKRKGLMERKVEQYELNLDKFDDFMGDTSVLFVLDAFRHQVKAFAKRHGGKKFFYCDLDSFLDVEKCHQWSAPIYIWGHDGSVGPLRADDD